MSLWGQNTTCYPRDTVERFSHILVDRRFETGWSIWLRKGKTHSNTFIYLNCTHTYETENPKLGYRIPIKQQSLVALIRMKQQPHLQAKGTSGILWDGWIEVQLTIDREGLKQSDSLKMIEAYSCWEKTDFLQNWEGFSCDIYLWKCGHWLLEAVIFHQFKLVFLQRDHIPPIKNPRRLLCIGNLPKKTIGPDLILQSKVSYLIVVTKPINQDSHLL